MRKTYLLILYGIIFRPQDYFIFFIYKKNLCFNIFCSGHSLTIVSIKLLSLLSWKISARRFTPKKTGILDILKHTHAFDMIRKINYYPKLFFSENSSGFFCLFY